MVDSALQGSRHTGAQVLAAAGGIDITRAMLRARCSPGAWLNDDIINFYLELIAARNRAQRQGNGLEGVSRIVCMPTHLLTKLTERGGVQLR